MKYLELKDLPMHVKARNVIKKCAECHPAKVPGYVCLPIIMKTQLRQTVGETYWKKSEALLFHILKQKRISSSPEKNCYKQGLLDKSRNYQDDNNIIHLVHLLSKKSASKLVKKYLQFAPDAIKVPTKMETYLSM